MEVVGVGLHPGVVRMPEQILQPPDSPRLGGHGRVEDEVLQVGDRAEVAGILQHLLDGLQEAGLGQLGPADEAADVAVDRLSQVDLLVPWTSIS